MGVLNGKEDFSHTFIRYNDVYDIEVVTGGDEEVIVGTFYGYGSRTVENNTNWGES